MNLNKIGMLFPMLIGLNSASAALITMTIDGTVRVNEPVMDNAGNLMSAEFRQEFGFGNGDAISLTVTYDDAAGVDFPSQFLPIRDQSGLIGTTSFSFFGTAFQSLTLGLGPHRFSAVGGADFRVSTRHSRLLTQTTGDTSFSWRFEDPLQSDDASVQLAPFDFSLDRQDSTFEVASLDPLTRALVADALTISNAPDLFTTTITNDPDNGQVGSFTFQVNDISVVPEPSTALLAGLVVLGLFGRRRRV